MNFVNPENPLEKDRFNDVKQIIIRELDRIKYYDSLSKIYNVIHTFVKMEEGDANDGI